MFSLRTLLIAVAIAAVGAVALATRTEAWAGVLVAITCLLLAASILTASTCAGLARAKPLGFLIFALVYVMPAFSEFMFSSVAQLMPTRQLLVAAWRRLEIDVPPPANQSFPGVQNSVEQVLKMPLNSVWLSLADGPAQEAYLLELHSFMASGHCLFTLAFGFLGAMLGSFLWRRANAASHSPTSVP